MTRLLSAYYRMERDKTRLFSSGWSQGPDQESWRVGEISNMFDILPTNCQESTTDPLVAL